MEPASATEEGVVRRLNGPDGESAARVLYCLLTPELYGSTVRRLG